MLLSLLCPLPLVILSIELIILTVMLLILPPMKLIILEIANCLIDCFLMNFPPLNACQRKAQENRQIHEIGICLNCNLKRIKHNRPLYRADPECYSNTCYLPQPRVGPRLLRPTLRLLQSTQTLLERGEFMQDWIHSHPYACVTVPPPNQTHYHPYACVRIPPPLEKSPPQGVMKLLF